MRWLVLVAAAMSILAAQTPKKKTAPKKTAPPAVQPAADKWPVATLKVEGADHYTREQILGVAGLKVGQLAGKPEFDAARDRLLATGLFESVGYRFAPAAGSNAFEASFQIVEVQPIYPVRFERLPASEADLKKLLRDSDPLFGDSIAATDVAIKRYNALLSEHLKMTVIARVMADAPDKFSIVFRPNTPEPSIAEVKFEGNAVVPSAQLLAAIQPTAYGAGYREPVFRQMLETAIKPIYEARGRIQVAFPKVEVAKAEKVNGLVLTVTIDEGPSFDIGEIRWSGGNPFGGENLTKMLGVSEGDLANMDKVRAGLDAIRAQMHRQGYLKTEFETKRTHDLKRRTVDLAFNVISGPQFLLRDLKIEGLDIHGEAEIKKLWTAKSGMPFNSTYPDYFLNQVQQRGLFDDLAGAKSKVDLDEATSSVDVTLIFQASKAPDAKGRAKGAYP